MAKDAKAKTKAKPAPERARNGKATKRAALPLPAGVPAPAEPHRLPKAVRLAEQRHLRPLTVAVEGASADVLDRLWDTVESRRRAGDIANSHSARLLARGTAKVAQKLGEEAVECVIEAT